MIKLYDKSMNLLQILHNAFNISYSQKLNEVDTASFSMPYDDPKTLDCVAFNFVEIFDKNERIDLFRIIPSRQVKTSVNNIVTYQCEHVLSTLLDDIMFGYTNLTSASQTLAILTYLLSNQSVTNWYMSECDFEEYFEYKFENNNILKYILDVPRMFTNLFKYTYNTTVYPWALKLKSLPATSSCRILYKRNLIGIEKYEDPTQLGTRLYGLGAGEGINQINISSINSNLPYLDSSNISTYGIICKLFIDKNILTPAELKSKMQALLSQIEIPKITYTVKAADLYKITNESLDKFIVGAKVDAYDSELGISFSSIVTSVTKNNIDMNPGDIEITISNKTETINNTISNLESKSIEYQTTSQGSSCIDSICIQDNCDNVHPGKLKFFLSDEVVFVNKCILNYEIDYFRAYEKSITSDPGNTSGSSGSLLTTSQGYEGSPPTTPWTMSLPAHVHYLADHTHSVPGHSHNIDYGIYEFGFLPPSVVVKVDGNVVAGVTGLAGSNIDIMSYLDATGNKVDRSIFHTIEIIPDTSIDNPEGLARIIANVNWKVFIRNNSGLNS